MSDEHPTTLMDSYIERGFQTTGFYTGDPLVLEAKVRSTLAQEKIAECLDRIACVMEQG